MTTLHAGGKFGGDGYRVSGGLHGVGVSVVNALSKEVAVSVHRGGSLFRQEYHLGKPVEKQQEIGTTDHEEPLSRSVLMILSSAAFRLTDRYLILNVLKSTYEIKHFLFGLCTSALSMPGQLISGPFLIMCSIFGTLSRTHRHTPSSTTAVSRHLSGTITNAKTGAHEYLFC